MSKFTNDTCSELDIGYGNALTIQKFAGKIKQLTRSDSILDFGKIKPRENEPALLEADITSISNFGWTPEFELDRGLKVTISHIKHASLK